MQECFAFAAPPEILGAVKLYCCDLYGGMLTWLDGVSSNRLTNCWGTIVKDVWGLPRSTHRVFIPWLSCGHSSTKEDLLSRWPKFYRSLLSGPSPEVAIVARMAAADIRSTTAANNKLIFDFTGIEASSVTTRQVRESFRQQEPVMSDRDQENAASMAAIIENRALLHQRGENTDHLDR